MQELTLKQLHRQSHDDLEVAARRFGHGSLEPMTMKLGLMNSRSFSNKLNPNFENAHCAWHEGWEIVRHAQDLAPVRTELAALGYTVAPLPQLQAASMNAEAYLRGAMSKFSKLVCANDVAVSDNSDGGREYSSQERVVLESEGMELIQAVMGFIASVKQK